MIIANDLLIDKDQLFLNPLTPCLEDTPPDETVADAAPAILPEPFERTEPPLPFERSSFCPPPPDVADAPFAPRVLDYSWREPLICQVANWLQLLVDRVHVVELRALNVEMPNGAKAGWCLRRRLVE